MSDMSDFNKHRTLPVAQVAFYLMFCFVSGGWVAWAKNKGDFPLLKDQATLDTTIHRFEHPGREKWQKPDEVIRALELKEGMHIADIGAGSGYFTRRFARALGDNGKVYAVDITPGLLKYNRETLEKLQNPYNVEFVIAEPNDPKLSSESVDLAFLCNTYIWIKNPVVYFQNLKESLKPGGRVVIIAWHHDLKNLPPAPSIPVMSRQVSRERVLKEMTKADYELVKEHSFLPYQYFLEFESLLRLSR